MTNAGASTMSEALIAEVTREAATTRRVLERVPEDRLTWKPHPRSMSLGRLALHVAAVPGAIAELLREPIREVPNFTPPEATSLAEILGALDRTVSTATSRLAAWTDEDLHAEWKMVKDGRTVFALPRIEMLRSVMLNHWYHHRGQLTVYLRLLDVPLPSVYGPTADESPFS
jgi:uncharacterized damage-inducible protein DinB